NVQQDCRVAKCAATGVRAVVQERVQSDKTEVRVVLNRFIINTHAFHNAHYLHATLSRNLWAPVPLFSDRESKNAEFSAQLRD
ncbi:hypothetical protein GGX14DRAFT_315951, partial [Mycena pura]